MAENSKIEWTDHTFNPWIGCTKVSPACDHCYAEDMMDKRYKRVKWGPHGERQRTAKFNWNQPRAWDRKAANGNRRARVFCASLADVFDNQVPAEWRRDLFDLIRATPNLIWLLLTKRPQNIIKMAVAAGGLPANVALGTSTGDQVEANRNVPALLAAKAELKPLYVFVSAEPLLGPIDFSRIELGSGPAEPGAFEPGVEAVTLFLDALKGARSLGWSGIDQIIVGGESGKDARPMHPAWARAIRDQCLDADVAYFFKQWGEWAPGEVAGPNERSIDAATWFPDEWVFQRVGKAQPYDHRDDEPDMFRIGKAKAGRTLDGVEHSEFPKVAA